jgi:TP901 family phage tail tape measure protein
MAERLAYLEAVVGADVTAFRRGMTEVRKDVGILSETVGGIGRAARNATLAFSAPMAVMGTSAIQTASDFEASMNNIDSIAQLTAAEFATLNERVKEFAMGTRGGFVDTADALYEVYSAGASGEQAFDIMQQSVYTAEAGLADLQVTTKALTAAMLAYSAESYDAARVSDILTRTVQVGVGEMGEFASSMGRVSPLAAALGISLEELGANWAFITQRGASAGTAATELYGIMSKLLKPTEDLEAAMQSLGVSSGQELVEEFGGLKGALEALYDEFDNSETKMAAAFGNERAIRGLLKIINDTEAWNAAMEEFNTNLDDATESAYEKQIAGFAAQMDLLKTAVEGASIVIGEKMLPVLTPFVQKATALINQIHNINPEIIQMGLALTAVAVALPPITWLMTGLLNPLGAAVLGVTALTTAIGVDFMGAQGIFKRVVSEIMSDTTELSAAFDDFWAIIFPTEADLQPPEIPTMTVDLEEVFRIESGDTFWDIWAENYMDDMTWNEFKELNDVSQLLIPGQDLVVVTGEGLGYHVAGVIEEELDGVLTAGMVTNAMLEENFAANMRAELEGNIPESAGVVLHEILFPEATGNRFVDPSASLAERVTQGLALIAPIIGDYITTTLIPNVSFHAGRLAGKTATLLHDAVSAGIRWAFSDAPAEGAGAFFAYMDENVAQPFAEGFTEALGEGNLEAQNNIGTGLTNVGDFLDSIINFEMPTSLEANLRGLREAFMLWADFTFPESVREDIEAIGDNLQQFGEDVSGFPWSKTAGGFLILSAAVGRFIAVTTTSVARNASEWLVLMGSGINNFVDFTQNTDGVEGMLRNIGVGLLDLAAGVLLFPLQMFDEVLKLVEGFTQMEMPDLSDMMMNWREDVRAWISGESQTVDPEVEFDYNVLMNEGSVSIEPPNMSQIQTDLELLIGSTSMAEPVMMTAPIEFEPGMTSFNASSMNDMALQDEVTLPYQGPVNLDFTQATLAEDAAVLSDELQSQLAASTVADFGLALSTYLIENPDGGAEGFIETYLYPIETAWLDVFGEDSASLAAYANFLSETQVMSTDIGNAVDEMKESVGKSLLDMVTLTRPQMTDFEREFEDGKRRVDDFVSSVWALIDMDANIEGRVDVTGSVNISQSPAVAGARADGGHTRGGRTYLVGEEGPELFTPGQTGSITPNDQMGGRGGNGNTTNYIIVEGIKMDLYELLEDLEREGINLKNAYTY